MGINEGGNNIIYVVSINLLSELSECMDYGYCLWFFLVKCYGICIVGFYFNSNIIYSC